jgi:hypothetical protein
MTENTELRSFRVIASEAKQSRAPGSDWIASSQELLAITAWFDLNSSRSISKRKRRLPFPATAF